MYEVSYMFCSLAPAVQAQVGGVTVGTFASSSISCSAGDLYATSDTFLSYQCGPADTWVMVPSTDSANSFTGNNTHAGTKSFTGSFRWKRFLIIHMGCRPSITTQSWVARSHRPLGSHALARHTHPIRGIV